MLAPGVAHVERVAGGGEGGGSCATPRLDAYKNAAMPRNKRLLEAKAIFLPTDADGNRHSIQALNTGTQWSTPKFTRVLRFTSRGSWFRSGCGPLVSYIEVICDLGQVALDPKTGFAVIVTL